MFLLLQYGKCQKNICLLASFWTSLCSERNDLSQSSKWVRMYLACRMLAEKKTWLFSEVWFIGHLSCLWRDEICNVCKFLCIKGWISVAETIVVWLTVQTNWRGKWWGRTWFLQLPIVTVGKVNTRIHFLQSYILSNFKTSKT